MPKTRRRRQSGGELPFFGSSFDSFFGSDKNKVNEEAELKKETENIKANMDRLKRKLEAYERKMTKLESFLTHYQDLATKALKMHSMYEGVLHTLEGKDEDEEDEDDDDLGSLEEDIEPEELAKNESSVNDSAVD